MKPSCPGRNGREDIDLLLGRMPGNNFPGTEKIFTPSC